MRTFSLKALRASATARHASIVFAAMAFVNVANFGFHLGAVRLLGIAPYGALAAIFAMLLVLSVPATVLQAVVATTIGELSERSDDAGLRRLGLRMFGATLAAGGAIALIGWLLATPIDRYLAVGDVTALGFAWTSAGLVLCVAVLRGVLQGTERFGAFAVSLGLEAGGNVFIGLPVLAAHGGIRGAMLANMCAVALALVFSLAWIVRGPRGAAVDVDLRRLFAKFVGTAAALVSLAAMAWSDVMLVRHFGTPEMSGLYGALAIVGKIVLFSAAFLPAVLLPKVSRIGLGSGARALVIKVGAIGLAICALELVVLAAVPRTVLLIVAGGGAAAAAPYLPFYAGAICALAMTTIVANYNVALHRFGFVVPLLLIELGEIVAIYHRHATLGDVVTIVAVGHSCAFVLCAAVTWAADVWRGRVHELVQEPGG